MPGSKRCKYNKLVFNQLIPPLRIYLWEGLKRKKPHHTNATELI
jgi:hypothetical protein